MLGPPRTRPFGCPLPGCPLPGCPRPSVPAPLSPPRPGPRRPAERARRRERRGWQRCCRGRRGAEPEVLAGNGGGVRVSPRGCVSMPVSVCTCLCTCVCARECGCPFPRVCRDVRGAAAGCRFSCPPVGAAVPRRPAGRMREGLGSLPPAAGASSPRRSPGLRGARRRCGSGAESALSRSVLSLSALSRPGAPFLRPEPPARRPPLFPLLRWRESSPLREGRAARGEPRSSPGQSGVPAVFWEGERAAGPPPQRSRDERSAGRERGQCSVSAAAIPAGPCAGLSLGAALEHPAGTPAPSRGCVGTRRMGLPHRGSAFSGCCSRGMVRGNFFFLYLTFHAGNNDKLRLKKNPEKVNIERKKPKKTTTT